MTNRGEIHQYWLRGFQRSETYHDGLTPIRVLRWGTSRESNRRAPFIRRRESDCSQASAIVFISLHPNHRSVPSCARFRVPTSLSSRSLPLSGRQRKPAGRNQRLSRPSKWFVPSIADCPQWRGWNHHDALSCLQSLILSLLSFFPRFNSHLVCQTDWIYPLRRQFCQTDILRYYIFLE